MGKNSAKSTTPFLLLSNKSMRRVIVRVSKLIPSLVNTVPISTFINK